jgi:Rha family phage regulatory protein
MESRPAFRGLLNFKREKTMTNELTTINLIKRDNDLFVSSKEVAERFGKKHFHVLRDIDNLQIPDNYRLSNFGYSTEKDSSGIDRPVVYMTRDGFSILAFGFTGKQALAWKIMFLEAFNKMESYVKEQIPALESKIRQLETEKNILMLSGAKAPHPLKNTVLVPQKVNTLFGPEIEYRRVKKDSDRYSSLSFKEGELKRLSQCISGMANKMDHLTREVALLRRN